MSTGSLLLPPGYHPLIDGAVVPSGKLAFYRSGTTTEQSTYSDSTLDTANSNPVQLNANGGLDTLVYGDPSTGFKYRMRVYSSADVLLDTHDDLLVWGADTATYSEGSFTGTLTGYATPPTGTVKYRIGANSAGTGKLCTLYLDSAITGTSDANSLTMTGLPAAVTPSVNRQIGIFYVTDNSASNFGGGTVSTSNTISFFIATASGASTFTTSGTKGLGAGWSVSYPL